MELTIEKANEIKDDLAGIFDDSNDKLNYAIRKNIDRIDSAMKSLLKIHNEIMSDLRDDFCLTDKDTGGKLTQPNGSPMYTPANSKAINAKAKPIIEEYLAKTIIFEPYFAKLPSTPGYQRILKIDLFTVEELTGVLFDPKYYSEGEYIVPTPEGESTNSYNLAAEVHD